ncbi:MAG TPA: zinc ribbon domain-containing protein [Candidatus Aminicenantes bacterium]|nr:zinc ribbon domain-containing protein [Candidatus Aminicenantes bacterium]HPB55846.1 zinc ribbon domain-containing protein [Candidatus Aminicenantes bacterium]
MPIYEYRCLKCGYDFEEIQHFNDPVLTECPKCFGRVEKVVSAPAFKFVGSGWYLTDYAKKSFEGSGKNEVASTGTKSPEAGASAPVEKKPVVKKDPLNPLPPLIK